MGARTLVRMAVAGSWLGLAACAGSVAPPATPAPAPPGAAAAGAPSRDSTAADVPYRGVPGFDTSIYPGEAALRSWKAESPYHWVGYYLPAPCHTDSSWVGRRAALEQAGWGVAIVFTGEQDWGAAAPVTGPSRGAATPAPRCTRSNLTPEVAAADAGRADSVAAGEGFPRGSAIYLDVERVDSVSAPLAAYVRGWIGGLLDRGRYVPALYLHARNLEALRPILQSELARRGSSERARIWVAGGGSAFDVHAAPAESGSADVAVWQGAHDVRESHGGVTLRIDVNVAELPSPSAPSGGAR